MEQVVPGSLNKNPQIEMLSAWDLDCSQLSLEYGEGLVSNDTTEVVTIIPTYGELYNGNFIRFLRSLTRQSATTLKNIEVIFSINNSLEDSTNKTSVFEENQKMIGVIKIIQSLIRSLRDTGEIDKKIILDLSKIFSENEMQTIIDVVKQYPNLSYIDLSSPGKAIGKLNPRGVAKDIAGKIAFTKLKNKKGYLDFLDGDCILSRSYYEEILSKVGSSNFLVKPLYTLPSFPETKYENPWLQIYNIIAYYREEYLSAKVMYLGGKKTDLNTPSQCISGEAFKKIDGYPSDVPNEDYKFAVTFRSIFPNEAPMDVNTKVGLYHRGRASSVDGKHIGLLAEGVQVGNLEELENNLDELGLETRMILKDLSRLNAEYEKHPLYLSFRKEEYRKEKIKRHFALKLSSECITDFLSGKLEDFSKRLNKVGFSSNQIGLILETLQLIVGNYFPKNEKLSQTDLLTKLTELLPEFLQPMAEEEPDYRQLPQPTIKYRSINPQINIGDFLHIASAYNRFRATLD